VQYEPSLLDFSIEIFDERYDAKEDWNTNGNLGRYGKTVEQF